MSRWIPSKRREFVQKLRQLGFDGPYSGTKHQFMIYMQHRLTIPSIDTLHPKGAEILKTFQS